jgi:hypothetical protein
MQCQYRVTFYTREMADAGNFGGSVAECEKEKRLGSLAKSLFIVSIF